MDTLNGELVSAVVLLTCAVRRQSRPAGGDGREYDHRLSSLPRPCRSSNVTVRSAILLSMTRLLELPPGIVELHVCAYLDPASLARLSVTNRQLHKEANVNAHWQTHVALQFGLTAQPTSIIKADNLPNVSWKDVFLAAWLDAQVLAQAQSDSDVLKLLQTHPTVLLSQSESQLRQELVLMQGLRRFPFSSSLIRQYATMLRTRSNKGAMPLISLAPPTALLCTEGSLLVFSGLMSLVPSRATHSVVNALLGR